MLVNTAASVKLSQYNFFLAPRAFSVRSLFVRSVTDTSIIFITPIPPTSREIPAIQITSVLVESLSFCKDFALSSWSSLLYFIPLSSDTEKHTV